MISLGITFLSVFDKYLLRKKSMLATLESPALQTACSNVSSLASAQMVYEDSDRPLNPSTMLLRDLTCTVVRRARLVQMNCLRGRLFRQPFLASWPVSSSPLKWSRKTWFKPHRKCSLKALPTQNPLPPAPVTTTSCPKPQAHPSVLFQEQSLQVAWRATVWREMCDSGEFF